MSAMIEEVYEALRQAGVDDRLARRAANAVMASHRIDDLLTKKEFELFRAEMRADMAELKADLIKWHVGTMAILTGIITTIVRLG